MAGEPSKRHSISTEELDEIEALAAEAAKERDFIGNSAALFARQEANSAVLVSAETNAFTKLFADASLAECAAREAVLSEHARLTNLSGALIWLSNKWEI